MTARLDARLALPAAAAWAAAAALVGWSAAAALRATVVVTVLLVAALLLHRLKAAALACGLVLGAASATLHVWVVRSGPVAEVAQRHASADLTLRLVRDPLARAPAHRPQFVLVDATVTTIASRPADAPVLLIAHGARWRTLLPGQRLRVHARLAPPRAGDSVSAVAFASSAPILLGHPPWWQRIAGAVRARLRAACGRLPPDERGLVPGLVVGDVSRMPPSLTDAFRTSGLTHLNAVSGENCAVVLGAVVFAARRSGLGRRQRLVLCAVALAAFVVLARPSPSVLRAAVMGAAALTAAALGRRPQPLALLSLAVLVLVLVDPFLSRQVGFALSVAATAAIVLAAPALTRTLSRSLPRPLAAAIAVSVAAQLACTPLLVALFGQLTPWAIPANLAAAPAVPPATVLGVLAAVVAVPLPPVASLLAWAAAVPAAWLALVARGFASMPGSGLHGPTGLPGLLLVTSVAVVAALAWRVRPHVRRAMLGAWPA